MRNHILSTQIQGGGGRAKFIFSPQAALIQKWLRGMVNYGLTEPRTISSVVWSNPYVRAWEMTACRVSRHAVGCRWRRFFLPWDMRCCNAANRLCNLALLMKCGRDGETPRPCPPVLRTWLTKLTSSTARDRNGVGAEVESGDPWGTEVESDHSMGRSVIFSQKIKIILSDLDLLDWSRSLQWSWSLI